MSSFMPYENSRFDRAKGLLASSVQIIALASPVPCDSKWLSRVKRDDSLLRAKVHSLCSYLGKVHRFDCARGSISLPPCQWESTRLRSCQALTTLIALVSGKQFGKYVTFILFNMTDTNNIALFV